MKQTDLFRKWIRQQLVIKNPGDRLPTELQLAKEFLISRITVNRIISLFVKQGAITRVQGKGMFIPFKENPSPLQIPRSPRPTSQIIFDAVVQSISSGEFKIGTPLPAIKLMSYQFKVSYASVVKAYQKLVHEENVIKVGKTFFVGSLKEAVSLRSNREVYIFRYKSDDFSYLYKSDLKYAYQKMEMELHANGFFLRYASSEKWEELSRSWIKTQDFPAGIMFSEINADKFNEYPKEFANDIIAFRENCPPLLLDLRTAQYNKELGKVHQLTRGHMLTTSSRAMVEYITASGFDEIIFFMNESNYIWSFESNSLPLVRIFWMLKELKSLIKVRYVLKPYASHKKHLTYLRNFKIEDQHKKASLNQFGKVDHISSKNIAAETTISQDFSAKFPEYCNKNSLWIFSSDSEAAEAISWLRSKNFKIPEDISIMGLENDPRYFHLGLSSCGPDWDTIGYLMAHSLIGDIPIAKTGKGFIKTKSDVIKKLTTR